MQILSSLLSSLLECMGVAWPSEALSYVHLLLLSGTCVSRVASRVFPLRELCSRCVVLLPPGSCVTLGSLSPLARVSCRCRGPSSSRDLSISTVLNCCRAEPEKSETESERRVVRRSRLLLFSTHNTQCTLHSSLNARRDQTRVCGVGEQATGAWWLVRGASVHRTIVCE